MYPKKLTGLNFSVHRNPVSISSGQIRLFEALKRPWPAYAAMMACSRSSRGRRAHPAVAEKRGVDGDQTPERGRGVRVQHAQDGHAVLAQAQLLPHPAGAHLEVRFQQGPYKINRGFKRFLKIENRTALTRSYVTPPHSAASLLTTRSCGERSASAAAAAALSAATSGCRGAAI
jgi:hypothetical protein